jgi:hypothetical protein
MSKKIQWILFILYLAIFGSYCGLEVDTFIEDLPFFQISTFLLLFNVIFVLLIPPFLYAVFSSLPSLWNKRIVRAIILIFNSIYFHFMILLALYRSIRDMDFDFYFFWYNATFAPAVLWKLFAPGLIAIALMLVLVVFIQKSAFSPLMRLLGSSKKFRYIFTALLVASLLCQLITFSSIRGSAAGFLYSSFISDRRLRDDYRTLHADHIAKLQKHPPSSVHKGNPSVMGDIVFFVILESLNSHMTGSVITPQFMKASRDGILFKELYAGTIQSERSWECILCGTPASITRHLVEEYPPDDIKKLNCLPQMFKALGYRPIVFYGGCDNPRAIKLFESLGFEEIMTSQIMKPGDVMYDWGYREDLFYARIDEYLQRHHAGEKLFVYITDSATNHTPFHVLDETQKNKVPYPDPKSFAERLSNTTFVQDEYFGRFYERYLKNYHQRASLIAMSDHAWPVPIHKNNIYNERGAYEENFLISMLFVPSASTKERFAINSTVPFRYSQMDIFPTIRDLTGLEKDARLGESLTPWLLSSEEHNRPESVKNKLSVQPYGGGFISIVDYPQKYLFSVLDGNVAIYDLKKDPQERSPSVFPNREYLYLIRDLFKD